MKVKTKLNISKIILNYEDDHKEDTISTAFTSPTNPCNLYLVEILPKLFIADYDAVQNKEILKNKNISVIFNLTQKNCKNCFEDDFKYETYDIPDNSSFNINHYLKRITKKIHYYHKRNKIVVIHCYKGISRAPTMAIAYLMKYLKKSFDQAFDMVQSKSKIIDPNAGFLIQLMNSF